MSWKRFAAANPVACVARDRYAPETIGRTGKPPRVRLVALPQIPGPIAASRSSGRLPNCCCIASRLHHNRLRDPRRRMNRGNDSQRRRRLAAPGCNRRADTEVLAGRVRDSTRRFAQDPDVPSATIQRSEWICLPTLAHRGPILRSTVPKPCRAIAAIQFLDPVQPTSIFVEHNGQFAEGLRLYAGCLI